MRKTYADLFSGFGGAALGAKAAGLQLAWGIELDPKIAEVANYNLGQHTKVANLLDCDPVDFERVDVLHASPPCTRASVANSSAEVNEDGLKESPLDIALADKVIEFINVLQPSVVTLENVYAYRLFQSWRGGRKTKGIQQTLLDAKYWLHVDHVNCANYSVPQARKRIIVRAVRGGLVPYLPQPEPWNGWCLSIKDLIPGLPTGEFSSWQLAILPKDLKTSLVANGKYKKKPVIANQKAPAFTITSNSNQTNLRAFLDEKNGGRVVRMTPRCLARFQSFPDTYVLSDNKILDVKGIGNAVPPLMYQQIISGLVNA